MRLVEQYAGRNVTRRCESCGKFFDVQMPKQQRLGLWAFDNITEITLTLTTERLERAIALLDRFHPKEQYPELWQALNAELNRRKLAASAHPIVIARRHLLDLLFAVKEALQLP